MSHSYKLGDRVEIAGKKVSSHSYSGYMPYDVLFLDVGSAQLPPPDVLVWTKVTIGDIAGRTIGIYWKDDSCLWFVHYSVVDLYLRPIGSDTVTVSTNQMVMATNCLECGTGFMYPVEYNHPNGRVCYSCKKDYRWKYPDVA